MDAGQDLTLSLTIGVHPVEQAAAHADGQAARGLADWAGWRLGGTDRAAECTEWALDAELLALTVRHPDRSRATTAEPEHWATVEPTPARFCACCELFPPLRQPRPGVARHPEGLRGAPPTWRRWASTSCTCLPSTPSG